MSDASGTLPEAYVAHLAASLAQFIAQQEDTVVWTGLTSGLDPNGIFDD